MENKKKSFSIDKDTAVALTVVALDPVRAKIAQALLALLGLRNVTFISTTEPVKVEKTTPAPAAEPEAPKKKASAKPRAKKKA